MIMFFFVSATRSPVSGVIGNVKRRYSNDGGMMLCISKNLVNGANGVDDEEQNPTLSASVDPVGGAN